MVLGAFSGAGVERERHERRSLSCLTRGGKRAGSGCWLHERSPEHEPQPARSKPQPTPALPAPAASRHSGHPPTPPPTHLPTSRTHARTHAAHTPTHPHTHAPGDQRPVLQHLLSPQTDVARVKQLHQVLFHLSRRNRGDRNADEGDVRSGHVEYGCC